MPFGASIALAAPLDGASTGSFLVQATATLLPYQMEGIARGVFLAISPLCRGARGVTPSSERPRPALLGHRPAAAISAGRAVALSSRALPGLGYAEGLATRLASLILTHSVRRRLLVAGSPITLMGISREELRKAHQCAIGAGPGRVISRRVCRGCVKGRAARAMSHLRSWRGF